MSYTTTKSAVLRAWLCFRGFSKTKQSLLLLGALVLICGAIKAIAYLCSQIDGDTLFLTMFIFFFIQVAVAGAGRRN